MKNIISNPQVIHDPRPVVFKQYICLACELFQNTLALIRFQIECDALFIVVQVRIIHRFPIPIWPVSPGIISSTWYFHLDHSGTKVSQYGTCIWTCNNSCQIQNNNIIQSLHFVFHVTLPPCNHSFPTSPS